MVQHNGACKFDEVEQGVALENADENGIADNGHVPEQRSCIGEQCDENVVDVQHVTHEYGDGCKNHTCTEGEHKQANIYVQQ